MLQDAAIFSECLLLTNESDEEGEELLHQHHNVADWLVLAHLEILARVQIKGMVSGDGYL